MEWYSELAIGITSVAFSETPRNRKDSRIACVGDCRALDEVLLLGDEVAVKQFCPMAFRLIQDIRCRNSDSGLQARDVGWIMKVSEDDVLQHGSVGVEISARLQSGRARQDCMSTGRTVTKNKPIVGSD